MLFSQKINITYNKQDIKVYLFIILLFLINPLISILVGYIIAILKDYSGKYNVLPFFVLAITVYISCINSISEPRSDMLWYLEDYYEVGSAKSYTEYVFTFGRNGAGLELAFPTINYLIYYLIGDSQRGYIFFTSFISYGLINYSLFRLGRALNYKDYIIFSSLIIVIFFPLIFTLSAVLLRQFMAGALFLYILVERCFYNKKCFILIAIMALLHTSALFFVPFLLFKRILKPIIKSNWFYFAGVIAALSLYQIVASILLSLLPAHGSILFYALDRASRDTTYDLGQMELYKRVLLFAMTFIPFIVFYISKYRQKHYDKLMSSVVHILTILGFFIIMNLHQSELSNRFMLYVYLLIPTIYLYLINFVRFSKLIALLVILGMIVIFYKYIQNLSLGHIYMSDHFFVTSIFNFL